MDVMLLMGKKVAGFALALPSGKRARYAVLWEPGGLSLCFEAGWLLLALHLTRVTH